MHCKNLRNKDFSLANDAETHSLNKEENKKRFMEVKLMVCKDESKNE
jgi:hypothetical protein